MKTERLHRSSQDEQWASVADVPGLPFRTFSQLQQAVRDRRYNLGVDPLIAARWANEFGSAFKKILVAAFSMLLIAAAVASIVGAFWFSNYWLLAAAPVMAIAFYFSNPASPARKWITVAGVASIFAFAEFLLNGLPTAALLTAYAGLTFAAVRAASWLTGSAFRKALLSDEALLLEAYKNRACSFRDNKAERVYEYAAERKD